MLRLAEIAVTVGWCVIWAIALAIVVWLSSRAKRTQAVLITCLIFALPLIWWWGSYPYYEYVAKRDYAVFQELCAKHAGDKIYRRVEGVEAVFQMKVRNQSREITHKRNQYTMEDPFGALGDVGSDRDSGIYLDWRGGRKHYQYFERPRVAGSTNGPPYIRHVARRVETASIDTLPKLDLREEEVLSRASRYGYSWEDISSTDMRDRWIAGGRIRVIDIKSGEVLAERTGFVFARDLNGGLRKYPWVGGHMTCPARHSTYEFVTSVLIPNR